MYDAETGQIVDGPVMNRYQMFMLIRGLKAAVHAHAQTIRDKQAVIDAEMRQPQRKRLNNGQCAAQVVDCDCRFCIPDEEPKQ